MRSCQNQTGLMIAWTWALRLGVYRLFNRLCSKDSVALWRTRLIGSLESEKTVRCWCASFEFFGLSTACWVSSAKKFQLGSLLRLRPNRVRALRIELQALIIIGCFVWIFKYLIRAPVYQISAHRSITGFVASSALDRLSYRENTLPYRVVAWNATIERSLPERFVCEW